MRDLYVSDLDPPASRCRSPRLGDSSIASGSVGAPDAVLKYIGARIFVRVYIYPSVYSYNCCNSAHRLGAIDPAITDCLVNISCSARAGK